MFHTKQEIVTKVDYSDVHTISSVAKFIITKTDQLHSITFKSEFILFNPFPFCKNAEERAARVRACNYVKFETGRNLPPVLKIVTRPVHAALT